MKKETKAIHVPFQKRDAYGALSFPVYNTVAYEFDSAQVMTEAFAGRVPEPDYSRVMNPTVTYFENRVKALSDADNVFALTTGMAAIPDWCSTMAKSLIPRSTLTPRLYTRRSVCREASCGLT